MLNMTPFLQNQDQFTEYGYPLWVVYVIWLTVVLFVSSLSQIHEVQIKFKKMVAELFSNTEFNLITLNSSKLI